MSRHSSPLPSPGSLTDPDNKGNASLGKSENLMSDAIHEVLLTCDNTNANLERPRSKCHLCKLLNLVRFNNLNVVSSLFFVLMTCTNTPVVCFGQ